ncbi:MAG: DUF3240 domain-containing protein [Betaproteobacteria bacterium]|nr:DUF3240 domain-containing protein [Betaproteobacteria bacterium]
MTDLLLTLVMPDDLAEHVEDLLLANPDLVRGFTASHADGHGSVVQLNDPAELVAGHAPRTLIRTIGPEDAMRAVLALIRATFPGANIYYWLAPLVEAGKL